MQLITKRYNEMKCNIHWELITYSCNVFNSYILSEKWTHLKIYAHSTETRVLVHDAGARSNTEHQTVTERRNAKGSKTPKGLKEYC